MGGCTYGQGLLVWFPQASPRWIGNLSKAWNGTSAAACAPPRCSQQWGACAVCFKRGVQQELAGEGRVAKDDRWQFAALVAPPRGNKQWWANACLGLATGQSVEKWECPSEKVLVLMLKLKLVVVRWWLLGMTGCLMLCIDQFVIRCVLMPR